MELAGKAAVITGGTGDLGSVVAYRFLDEGASVVLPWYKRTELEEFQQALSEERAARCAWIEADLTDEAQVRGVMDLAMTRFGRIDLLLNLVGGFAYGELIAGMDVATWDKMMDVNLKTAFLCTKHALEPMLEAGEGRIIVVSAKVCESPERGSAAYAVSKGGLLTFSQALREELKGTDISVNVVMPGIIDTPVTRQLMPHADHSKWVRPEEVADVILALCSDAAGAASGSVIRVFGGL